MPRFPLVSTTTACSTFPSAGKPKAVSIIPSTLSEVTPNYVKRALCGAGMLAPSAIVEVISVEPTAISGFLSTTGRVHLRYSGLPDSACAPPASIIVKMQAQDETARAVAVGADNYGMEARMYDLLVPELTVGTVSCFQIDSDPVSGNVVFVMEDLCLRKELYSVNQWRLGGCKPMEAAAVAHAFGRLHAQYWSWEAPLPVWLPATNDIEARDVVGLVASCEAAFKQSVYFTDLDVYVRAAVEMLVPKTAQMAAALASGPRTLLHHDARADNLFWGDANAPGGVVFLDWQMAGQGVGALDLAWFSSTSFLEPTDPMRLPQNLYLVEVYWRSLTESGVDGERYPFEAAWRDYVLGLAWSFLVILQAVKFGAPSDVMRAFVSRIAHAMVELDAHRVSCERLV